MNPWLRLLGCVVAFGLMISCLTPAAIAPAVTGTATASPAQASAPPAISTPATSGSPPAATAAATAIAAATTGGVTFVAGSSQKVCQLVGEIDRQTNQPTVNQTESRWGLVGNDLGYSFEHDGKLFFLFGDSGPTRTFNGKPNGPNSPNRNRDDNDAIAYTTDAAIGGALGACPHLTFVHYADGAYKNPVVLDDQGRPAITLRTNEVPHGGLSDGGHLYVFFATDNPVYQSGGPSPGNLGSSTRSAVAVSDDDGNTFHYLYDFSKGPAARFVTVAAAQGQDNYLYFWGTQGGALYRKSAPSLARQPAGTLGSPAGLEYFHGLNADGTPDFKPGEGSAVFLFHDTNGSSQVSDCMGELGVTWNPFVKRWLMLYNCAGRGPGGLGGVYLRAAPQPWGPWSDPQVIFNAERDGGYCNFIHRAVANGLAQCDQLAGPDQLADYGGSYGPYVLSRYTTGDSAKGTSTFYYTLSTWIPYTVVIMRTSIQRSP